MSSAEPKTETKKLPQRHEVPMELTWDLTVVYADDAAWEADFARIEAMLPAFTDMQEGFMTAASSLLSCLQARDEVGILYGKMRAYASLRRSEDNGNATSQARVDRAQMLGTRLSAATAYIEPKILGVDPTQLQEFIAQEAGLQLYSYYFETLERRRPHVRSAEVEDVLAQLQEAMNGTDTVYSLFNNADLKFPPIKNEQGEDAELTHGRYLSFLESRDRNVREAAFRAMHGEYYKWRNTLAATLSGAIKANVSHARVRCYDSALQAALAPDDIPTSVYRNLISTVREHLPILHRYLRLRKKLLGLEELRMWDLYVPMVAAVDKPVRYEEAQRLVQAAAQPLGGHYLEVLKQGFQERWVDVLENAGKTSGAFSDGSYVTPPYILMNWQDDLHRTFTLAHEFGHSLHSYFAREAQPYVYAGYTIFVAEVASTLNEALLTHHLVAQARREGDRSLQLYLLNSYAEGFRTTLYRQTLFAEFELNIHEAMERGEALTAESMSQIYLQINRDYYGAEVEVDECTAIEWARIPHFYYNFYVYQYATGISASAALSKQILEEGQPAVDRYLNFLRGGGSATSINLLRGAGVDMATPQPVQQALDVFADVIAQMEVLAEE